jgi:hypothetical protein
MNFSGILLASFIPLLIGFFWYGNLGFGKAWQKETGFVADSSQKGRLVVIFILTFIFSIFVAFIMQFLVIHQTGAFGMIGGDINKALPSYHDFMNDYGTAFRTIKHGALHGTMSGILLAFPIIAINALFERKSWKYIFIHAGYWTVCFGFMGAIICGITF